MIPGNANPLLLASAAEAAAAGDSDRSLRFNGNGNDDPYLERSVSSAGNRRTFTFAAWVKNDFKPGNDGRIFSAGTDPNNIFDITLSSSNEGSHLRIYNKTTTVHTNWNTANKLRDTSAWFHIVVGIDTTQATQTDRVKVYINGVHITENGTTNTLPSQNAQMAVNDAVNHYIGRSGYYGGDRLAGYLTDVYFIEGSQLTPTSFGAFDDNGVWQKGTYSGTYGTRGFHLLDFANESTVGHDSSGNGNDFTATSITSSLTNYSDDISIDSGNFYLDGRSGRFGFDGNSSTYIDCRLGTGANTTTNIIWTPTGGIASVTKIRVNSQYATHYRINEGSWTSFTSDGSTVQIFSGSAFTLTKLEIRRNNNGGSDFGHRVTFYEINDVEYQEDDPNDLDVLFDVPTNGEATDTGAGGEVGGNYCTLNPLKKSSEITLSNGNLDLSTSSTSNKCKVFGTFGVSSGKWYYEVTIGANHRGSVGWATSQDSNLAQAPGDSTGDYSLTFDTNKIYQGSYTSGYGTAFFTGMVIGVRVDATAGTIAFSQNGTDKGDAFTGQTGKTFWPIVGDASSGGTFDGSVNFGQRAFVYSAPSDYKALCTTNLPTPTIADGSDHFDSVTYTGNGTTAHSITGLSLASAPDLVWIKQRNATRDHVLQDILRGTGVFLSSNTNAADQSNGGTGSSSLGIQSFDSNGFTLGTGTGVNTSSGSYVAWCWDAGSSNTSISAGSLNSSAYDSSQTWSNGWDSNLNSSFPGTRSFDGDISTGGVVALGSTATWTVPNSGYAISSSLRVYGRLETSSGGFTITFSDSSTSTIPVNATKQWHTISGAAGKTITSIAVTKAANGDEGIFHAVEIDGKILLDNGVTPVDNFPSIASTCRANQTAGISIVTYTNPSSGTFTVGHGLNADVGMIITKHRNRAADWYVWHSAYTSEDDYINLNTTSAKGTATDFWGTSPPSSLTFGGKIGTSALGGDTDLAIVFSAVEGFSSFGSYTGNGSSDGPFAYTGHKIAWLMLKDSSTTGAWLIWDVARQAHNVQGPYLLADTADAESDSDLVDFLSNGFKIRTTAGSMNSSGQTYIYAAFSENAFSLNGGLAR